MHDASQQSRPLSASAFHNHHVHFPLEKQKHSFAFEIFAINNQESTFSDVSKRHLKKST